MDTVAWLGIAVSVAVILGMLALAIPHIREVRKDQSRARKLDDLHKSHT
jgi:hypothetical protein